MKKHALISLFLFLPVVALADDNRFVAGDDSPYTEICIAATESDNAAQSVMEKYAVTRSDISELSCNGMTLNRWISKFRSDSYADSQESIRVFAFRENNDSAETSMCIAAVTSSDEYSRLKEELFGNSQSTLSRIYCNNMPLRTFARRYGNADFRI